MPLSLSLSRIGLALGGGSVSSAVNGGGGGLPITETLVIDFDPLVDTDISITTSGAGTVYWMITEASSATATEIIAGTGAISGGTGTIDTVDGIISEPIPTLDGTTELFFHAVLCATGTTSPISNTDRVRAQQGTSPTQAGITIISGSPNITTYNDGTYDWQAWEFTGDGEFEITSEGEAEYELIAGGGGGGGYGGFARHGGGGAGGVLQGTHYFFEAGSFPITVGLGGNGARVSGSVLPQNGEDSTAIGLTSIGGGAGGLGNPVTSPTSGGSGGGGGGQLMSGGSGTVGQGNNGGSGSGNAGGGGGGAGGAGGVASPGVGGNSGAGVSSDITGSATNIAGGGAASGSTTAGTASHGGGTAGAVGGNNAGGNATTPGSGGGGANGSADGGDGFRGRFVIRIRQ